MLSRLNSKTKQLRLYFWCHRQCTWTLVLMFLKPYRSNRHDRVPSFMAAGDLDSAWLCRRASRGSTLPEPGQGARGHSNERTQTGSISFISATFKSCHKLDFVTAGFSRNRNQVHCFLKHTKRERGMTQKRFS